jgi:hypothetical protein
MLLELNQLIANILFSQPSTVDLFNPYSSENPALDVPGAHLIRQQNLKAYLCDRNVAPSVFLLAEAPGPWGCRFSGVPITSELQLLDPTFPVNGIQSSNSASPHKEYSASIYWKTLEAYHHHILTWNTVPFHPHFPDKPLSIRTPRMSEIKQFLPLLGSMLQILSPTTVIAIGRKAEKALAMLDVDAVYVRHPSQGGATLFAEGVVQELTKLGIAT